jgi:hypothetical protein
MPEMINNMHRVVETPGAVRKYYIIGVSTDTEHFEHGQDTLGTTCLSMGSLSFAIANPPAAVPYMIKQSTTLKLPTEYCHTGDTSNLVTNSSKNSFYCFR